MDGEQRPPFYSKTPTELPRRPSSYQDVYKLGSFAPGTSEEEKSIVHLIISMMLTPELHEYVLPLF